MEEEQLQQKEAQDHLSWGQNSHRKLEENGFKNTFFVCFIFQICLVDKHIFSPRVKVAFFSKRHNMYYLRKTINLLMYDLSKISSCRYVIFGYCFIILILLDCPFRHLLKLLKQPLS